MKTRIVGLACAVLLASAVSSAQADPIVITSGHIGEDFGLYTTVSLKSSAFSFVGVDFSDSFALRIPGGDGSEPPPKLGDVVDLNAAVKGTFLQCDPGSQCGPPADLDLKLMTAPLLVTPTVLKATQGFGAFVSHRPFTMTGTVGRQDVVGAGFFDLGYADGVDFYFSSPSSSPTPEPTSLFLLGTGIAALAAGRFKRGKTRTGDR